MASPQDSAHDLGLVLLRVFLGLILLTNGWAGVRNHEPTAHEFKSVVTASSGDAPALIGWIGEDILAAQPSFFAALIRYGGLTAGILLLIGALVRPTGWIGGGVFLFAFFLGRSSQEHWNLMAAACCATCALTSAGRYVGLDTSLDRALPTWLTWYRGGRGSKSSPFA